MSPLDPAIVDFIRETVASDRYAAYLRDTLMTLLAIDTTPGGSLADTATHERELLDWLAHEVSDICGSDVVVERVGINRAIADDPDYTLPSYAADGHGQMLPVDRVYADRSNLVVTLPGARENANAQQTAPPAVILNAPIDEACSWFAPRSAGGRVHGRGACGAKVQVALLIAQMKLLREVEEKFSKRATHRRVYQFVIDAAAGGHGSLSLAMDPGLQGVPVVVHASTDGRSYCAQPGIVTYRCRLSVDKNAVGSAIELFPFVVQELEAEGRQLRDETDHPMFACGQVQTNPGTLGHYGHGPLTVCDHVAIEIYAEAKANPERIGMKMIEFMDDALAEYTRVYGDKTREIDPATGKPKVQRHFELKLMPKPDVIGFRIDVWGQGGHMGALESCDNALLKAAYLLGALIRVAGSFPAIRAEGRLAESPDDRSDIVMTGAQSFSPTHSVSDVEARLTAAAQRGVQHYCQIRGRRPENVQVETAFGPLRGDAFAGSGEVKPMTTTKAAFRALGQPWPEQVAWKAGSDAWIYHHKGHPVVVFGAGKLEGAGHGDESIDMADLQNTLAVSTLATWSMVQ